MIELFHMDNMAFQTDRKADLIYADYIYENFDFSWADKYWNFLKEGGIFIAQTDWHSVHRYRIFMEDILDATFINSAVWLNEWGNHPKDRFHQCFDDIVIYTNVKSGWKFDSTKVQVPKKTISKGLNPSGRKTKTATAWIDDCTLTTTSKERVKKNDGHLIRWQKPKSLLHRIFSPFVSPGDLIIDPFMGSGTSMEVAVELGCDGIGIEFDKEPFELAKKRLGFSEFF